VVVQVRGITPVSDDAVERAKGKINSRGEPKLSAQVKQWPTPTSTLASEGGRDGGENLRTAVGGNLNPLWVEWLMGWPIGHTESKHWATAKSRCARQQRGSSSKTKCAEEVMGSNICNRVVPPDKHTPESSGNPLNPSK
jgi:hypothetical protein